MADETSDGEPYRSRGSDGSDERSRYDDRGDRRLASVTDAVDWLTLSVVRFGLAVVGVVLLLYAIGMLTGVDALDVAYDALGSELGRWIAVAVVGVFLLLVAIGGFGTAD